MPVTPPHPFPMNSGFVAHLRGVTAAALGYVAARAQLAGLESKEAAGHYLKIAAVLVAGALFATFGYLFFCLGIVFAIARLFENPNAWIWVALLVALAHFGATAACAFIVREWFTAPVFTSTIAEFRKDQEWLTKKTN